MVVISYLLFLKMTVFIRLKESIFHPVQKREIWSGNSAPSNWVTYKKGNQIAFNVDSSIILIENGTGQNKVIEIKPENRSALKNLTLDRPQFFSESGHLPFRLNQACYTSQTENTC